MALDLLSISLHDKMLNENICENHLLEEFPSATDERNPEDELFVKQLIDQEVSILRKKRA